MFTECQDWFCQSHCWVCMNVGCVYPMNSGCGCASWWWHAENGQDCNTGRIRVWRYSEQRQFALHFHLWHWRGQDPCERALQAQGIVHRHTQHTHIHTHTYTWTHTRTHARTHLASLHRAGRRLLSGLVSEAVNCLDSPAGVSGYGNGHWGTPGRLATIATRAVMVSQSDCQPMRPQGVWW